MITSLHVHVRVHVQLLSPLWSIKYMYMFSPAEVPVRQDALPSPGYVLDGPTLFFLCCGQRSTSDRQPPFLTPSLRVGHCPGRREREMESVSLSLFLSLSLSLSLTHTHTHTLSSLSLSLSLYHNKLLRNISFFQCSCI